MQIDQQFRLGNNQNALLLYQRYMADANVRDHREVIPNLLEMADKLVRNGLIKPGFFVYLLANRTYPGNSKTESGLARIKALMR